MKQAVLTDTGFALRDVPLPECGPNDVLVRILANGICASDIGRYRNMEGREGKELALGHEPSGIVERVGTNITSVTPGDKVTAFSGRFAEYDLFPPGHLVRLPDPVDPVWALGEPVACCVHAMNRSRITPGQDVAVVGCGFMGLVCLQLAKEMGADRLTAMDISHPRLDTAHDLGATGIENTRNADLAGRDTFRGEYDVVIEAAGNQAALDLCGYLVKQHGLLNLVGHHYSNGGMRQVFMNQWNVKAIDVVNGHVRRDDEKLAAMQQGIDMAAAGDLELASLITRYPLSNIEHAFKDCLSGREDLLKAVLVSDLED